MNNDLIGLYAKDNGRGPSIETMRGRRFYVLDPRPEEVFIGDIAHSVSQLCRFTGHTRTFYSVAQHCVLVSNLVEPWLALDGLLHDASEAYINDLSRPLKIALDTVAPGVMRGIEDKIHEAIAERFGTIFPHHPSVKEADNIALATERRDLMSSTEEWAGLPDPDPDVIVPSASGLAKLQFLRRFNELETNATVALLTRSYR